MSDGGNPLGGGMPPDAPQPMSPQDAAGGDAPTPLHRAAAHHKEVYKKISNADRLLRRIREEMDKLGNMGDTVTPEDVISAAGRVVGHGVPARDMASILADMPSQAGQGLAAWVSMMEAKVRQQEAEVARVKEISAFQMGVSAVQAMAAGDMQRQAKQRAAPMGGLAPGGAQAAGPAAGPMTPPTASPLAGPATAMPTPQGGNPLSPRTTG